MLGCVVLRWECGEVATVKPREAWLSWSGWYIANGVGFPGVKVKKKEGAEDGGEVGSFRNGKKNHGVTHLLEQGGENLEGMSCYGHDDLELAVGLPGRFTSGRGWVERLACESLEKR